MRRFVVIVAGLLLALCFGLVTWYLVENEGGKRAWREYEAGARQRGVKLSLAEHLPSRVEDEENFAAAPLFTRILDAGKAGRPWGNPFKLPIEAKPPEMSDPATGQRLNLNKWRSHLVAAGLRVDRAEGTDAELVLRALSRFDEAWAELSAAAHRPRSRFPVAWEMGGFAAPLPHLTVLVNGAKICALRIEAHLARGDSEAALQNLRLGFRMVRAVEREPMLIAGLTHIASLDLLERAIWSGFAADVWDEAAREEIERELQRCAVLSQYCFAFESERGALNTFCESLIAEPSRGFRERLRLLGTDSGVVPFFPRGWVRLNQARANKRFDEIIARVDPSAERFHDLAVPHDLTTERGFLERVRFRLLDITAPVYSALETRYLASHTRTQQILLASALQRFLANEGQWPQDLASLVPAYLPAVPRDVMDGAPIRYRLNSTEASYILYSIGRNQRDDGGVIGPKADLGRQLDWVWHSAAVPPASAGSE